MRERLERIRAPERVAAPKAALSAVLALALGVALGVFAKWLDELALDGAVWWHRPIEALDLGNFFSEIAVWLLAALAIAVCSRAPWWAALNVFAFFAGMCAAYHVYTVRCSGFDPRSYMMIWYGLTLLSPLPAALCWYAKGSGAAALLLDAGIFAAFFLSCFAVGMFYVSGKGVLYWLTFAAAVAVLYKSPKQLAVTLPAGVLLAFLFSPLWPFR